MTSAAATATAVTEKATQAKAASRSSDYSRFLGGDYVPAIIVAVLTIVMSIGTQAINSFFLSPRSLFDLFVTASILLLVSLGQAAVFLTRGIDLSVGPVMSEIGRAHV